MNLKLVKEENNVHWITDKYQICANCGRKLQYGFYCNGTDKCYCVGDVCNDCGLVMKEEHIHTKFFFDAEYDNKKPSAKEKGDEKE